MNMTRAESRRRENWEVVKRRERPEGNKQLTHHNRYLPVITLDILTSCYRAPNPPHKRQPFTTRAAPTT